jgi:hypothetical protein
MTTLGGPNQKVEELDMGEIGQLGEGDDDDMEEPRSVEMELCNKYYTLLQDPMIRIAISGIVVSEGKISASKTRQKLKSWFTEIGYKPFENSQLHLTTFLNSIWLVGCESLSDEFWWVHKAIILKFLYINAVAEACNLQQYGLTSKKSHIPRAALFIYDYIMTLDDEYFAELEAEFDELTKNNDDFCQVFMKSFDGAESKSDAPKAPKSSKSKSKK